MGFQMGGRGPVGAQAVGGEELETLEWEGGKKVFRRNGRGRQPRKGRKLLRGEEGGSRGPSAKRKEGVAQSRWLLEQDAVRIRGEKIICEEGPGRGGGFQVQKRGARTESPGWSLKIRWGGGGKRRPRERGEIGGSGWEGTGNAQGVVPKEKPRENRKQVGKGGGLSVEGKKLREK